MSLQLEYEIQTLRNVLIAKIDEANELKRKLGITPMVELKQDVMTGIQTIKESETYVFITMWLLFCKLVFAA